MTDIIRIQVRQLLKARAVHMAVLLFVLTAFIMIFSQGSDTTGAAEAASSLLPQTLPLLCGFSIIAAASVVGLAGGADFPDKTINHELTAGRTRAVIFFGRALPLLIAGPLAAIFACGVPYIGYSLLFGWGETLPLSAALTRFALMLFPLMRMSALFIFLLFVTKKQIVPVFASFIAASVSLTMMQGTSSTLLNVLMEKHWLAGFSNLVGLSYFDNWRTYDMTLTEFYTYYPELPASEIALTVGIGLLMTAVYLALGYHFFHADDLN